MTLPKGWAEATVDDLGEYLNGMAFKPDDWGEEGIGIIRIQNLTNPDKPLNKTTRAFDERYRVRAGDLLVSWSATLDAFVWGREDAVLNQHIFKVTPSPCVDKQFLFYQLRELITEMAASEHLHGSTMKHINRGPFLAHRAVLPPLAEQRRIVAKLDVLTARIARAHAELERVSFLANQLREKGLEAAFSGQLLAETAIQHGAFPPGWKTVRFDNAAEIASNLVAPKTILDLPHIAPNHIESARPKLLPYKTIREDAVISSKHHFFPGQILYSKIRPYLRKVVQVDFEGGCSADMYPINPKCHPRYLMYWMLSPQFTWLATRHEGRTVLPKINQNALNAIPTPLAPPSVQELIADKLDKIFTRADRMEIEAERSKKLLDRLEAALLAKAFRGELVPQDPTEEPASVLLERIKAEREAKGNKPKGGRGRRPNGSKEQLMTKETLPPRERLLKDSEKWPAVGLPFEAIAMRNRMPHDELRDALFELLSGPSPALRQRFDTAAEVMVIQRVAE